MGASLVPLEAVLSLGLVGFIGDTISNKKEVFQENHISVIAVLL